LLAGTLLGVLRDQPFDLIHGHHYEGLLAGLIARVPTRIPVVYDAHTMLVSELHHYDLGLTRRAKQRIAKGLERQLPRRADHVVTVNDEIAAQLSQHFAVPVDRVTTVASGVELEHFEPSRPRGSTPAGKTIIFTGNLAAYQGIDLLLDAFTRLRARRADVRLVLVGELATDPRVLLAERPELHDHVDLVVGDFAALPRHLAAADVAVNPRTECDGTPLKLLNYMAAGKAIVSFAGSAKEIADGETGLIVPNGDVSAFADALDRLLGDPPLAARLGAAASEYARRELSWDRAAQSLEGVYERVLGAERRG
jgi:glycosyltransferase involved in cell wall biosynthesis